MPTAIRRIRPLLLPVALVAILVLPGDAVAQDPPDPNETPGDDCQADPITCAADAVGEDLNERVEEGDCSGGGPEACLGIMLAKLMCAIDNREITQTACGPDQSESRSESDAGAPRVVRVAGTREGEALLRHVAGQQRGARLWVMRAGDRPLFRFVRGGSRDTPSGEVVVIRVGEEGSERSRRFLLGTTEDGQTLLVDLPWLMRQR